ncbi:MAG TPA: BREX system serine/threonine kinase PglW [Polyangia bacterium]|nr:BREX system serine/threonine kinase PglW [Polyangia bacterium]
MALGPDRIISPGQTPHQHEREAFEFVVRELPDTEPFRIWAFSDLIDPAGRRYDIDLLVLGYHALYLIEVKGHPGTLTGDDVDWQFTFPGGGRSLIENPARGAHHKARVLGSLLDRQFAKDNASRALRRPWVQPLVFLSHPDLQVKLEERGRMHVVTRTNLSRALRFAEFPGAPERLLDHPINRPTALATHRALLALGLRPSVNALKVEGLLLRDLLEDGSHYQDHLGVHQSVEGLKRRVRSYIIPAGTTAERREQLLRAARREAQLLTVLSDHKNILRLVGYTAEGPLGGPCVILEHIEDAQPLDAFLRANPDLPFEHRISIIQQVAEALEFCHRKEVVHRGLSPRTILVRRVPNPGGQAPPPEVKLYNFQLASAGDTSGTVHLTSLSSDQAAVYLAPEAIESPSSANVISDVFSLGAIAYLVLTGRPPGMDLAEREKLMVGGRLSIAAVRDDLAGGSSVRSLDAVVGMATTSNPVERADSAIEWLNIFLEEATAPSGGSDETIFINPHEARRGDHLSEKLEVVDFLGSGSTARVLRVRRKEKEKESEYALKISLSPDLDDRLHKEGRVLGALKSDRIVSLVEELTLGDRTCLLMTDAGESLAALIAREGPPSLDFARRWGEDLLRALESLEDKAVQHRDIKPANLGVLPGQSKKKRNLLLFDFSLTGAADTAITAGTPAYRDPFLPSRGRWDSAADRWSVAMTLHEMLTGARPAWGDGDQPAAATGAEIRISAERFDASVRSRLSSFFRRALARDAGQRFPSAEEMRVEWVSCFATASWTDVAEETTPSAPRDISGLTESTPVGGLPLSARAKNAIDRAGMTTLGELLRMPHNRLSTTRGIGRTTHQEILKFLDDARAVIGTRLKLSEEAPFVADYRGIVFGVVFVPGLDPAAASALEDAGLGNASLVASAPKVQVERILADHGGAAKILLDWLQESSSKAMVSGTPTTIEDWLDQLFAARGKRSKYLVTAAQLLGLEPVPGSGEHSDEMVGLAKRLGVTRAAVHIALDKARDKWREHPGLGELQARVGQALDRIGGVGPVAHVAEALAAEISHRSGVPAGGPDRMVEALVRVAAETTDELALGRIDHRLWLARESEALSLARALGARADELAGHEPLPATEEVKEALFKIVAGTSLASLAHDRLVVLAAEASRGAARSARLELYPRGLPAARAVALSAGALAPHQTTPDAIRRLVRARYPEAEEVPDRMALDALVRPLGLVWDEGKAAYVRPGAAAPISFETRLGLRVATTHTSHRPPKQSRENEEALDFDAKIRLAIEKRYFRVLDVTSGYDGATAGELANRFGARSVSIETQVLAEAERLMVELGVEPAVVWQADRQGPTGGDDWENLRRLMKKAAERVLARVVEKGRPVVLTQPGILARYGLDDVVGSLVERSQQDDAPPILLVNPTDDSAAPATIDASPRPLPVPLASQAQRLRVPEPWILNLHRGGTY